MNEECAMTSSALMACMLMVLCVLIALVCFAAVLIAYIHEREHEVRGKGMRERL
jgi:flagellar basal body-associated protein FliL